MSRGKRCRKRPASRRAVPLAALAVLAALALTAALALPRLRDARSADVPSGEERLPAQDKRIRPAPEPEPALPDLLLESMSLREKVCQLFVVMPSDLTGQENQTSAGESIRQALETWPVGGMIYDKNNLVTQEQTRAMLADTQGFSRIPLILTCDEEGGRVNRLMGKIGTTWVGAMLKYKDQGPEKAAENARTIGTDLVSCGFNMDLAPVADVWSNPANQAIGDRAYSDDFHQAAELVAAAVEGFHQGGAACTLKHFPGHGDTSADSHYGSVYVYKTLDQLRQEELLPFQAGIDAGADAVMMGHLILQEVDSQPALFSYKLVTELLREEMGFSGVVISDSLQMQAMTDHYSSGEIALSAVQAGVDLLLCPLDLESAVEALLEAVDAGTIGEARIDESVQRILRLKEQNGILADVEPPQLPPKENEALKRWRETVRAAAASFQDRT